MPKRTAVEVSDDESQTKVAKLDDTMIKEVTPEEWNLEHPEEPIPEKKETDKDTVRFICVFNPDDTSTYHFPYVGMASEEDVDKMKDFILTHFNDDIEENNSEVSFECGKVPLSKHTDNWKNEDGMKLGVILFWYSIGGGAPVFVKAVQESLSRESLEGKELYQEMTDEILAAYCEKNQAKITREYEEYRNSTSIVDDDEFDDESEEEETFDFERFCYRNHMEVDYFYSESFGILDLYDFRVEYLKVNWNRFEKDLALTKEAQKEYGLEAYWDKETEEDIKLGQEMEGEDANNEE
jgi:hypothetical protein